MAANRRPTGAQTAALMDDIIGQELLYTGLLS